MLTRLIGRSQSVADDAIEYEYREAEYEYEHEEKPNPDSQNKAVHWSSRSRPTCL
ncbi:MAG: hypothetical protein NXI32_28360 [bacterium]|nr:hypothetical protein [bacterium]